MSRSRVARLFVAAIVRMDVADHADVLRQRAGMVASHTADDRPEGGPFLTAIKTGQRDVQLVGVAVFQAHVP